MLVGSLFLDYDPLRLSPGDVAQADRETAKQETRFLIFYLMTMLMLGLVILALAVLDFWATARFGVQQQKQLVQQHKAELAAELASHRNRHADLN